MTLRGPTWAVGVRMTPGGGVTVRVSGVLDPAAGEHVGTVVTHCWEELGGAVFVDVSAATFVDDDAAHAVVRASGAACPHGSDVRVGALVRRRPSVAPAGTSESAEPALTTQAA